MRRCVCMDYTNTRGVRFKISYKRETVYKVRYYSGLAKSWPRNYRDFHCPTDESRREMFYILNHTKMCPECHDELIDYRHEDASMCKGCVLHRAQVEGQDEDELPDCPVCYHKMFTVDNSKRVLPCRHEVCDGCFRRMLKATPYTHDNGVMVVSVFSITCPMCRQESFYAFYGDALIRQVFVNTTI